MFILEFLDFPDRVQSISGYAIAEYAYYIKYNELHNHNFEFYKWNEHLINIF